MGDYEYHEPVMVQEVIDLLITDRSGVYVDGTTGGAGHSIRILNELSQDGCLIAMDVDPDAINQAKQRLRSLTNQIIFAQRSYSELSAVLAEENIAAVDGVLLDLGVSSYQIDAPERGFSYDSNGPLDMRMSSSQTQTAADVVSEFDEKLLSEIFFKYGEERKSRVIARQIVKQRSKQPIETTGDLVAIIERVLPFKLRVKSLSRIFQALRIYVNNELERLKTGLPAFVNALKPGGRLVVMSYHSLEDRIVKEFFREQENPCTCPPEFPVCMCHKKPTVKILTKRAITPTLDEIERNSRSRSAKLRAIEKL
ncbi:16S rRNA (cytosine(1402)-N(4))-methyltransferase RsmH [candidate division KSB1 bacterium]|nr:16S rRNA (cytosine(1402)-N(4))-methyltransferase RsmH [candidate division KSB1 bacterium]